MTDRQKFMEQALDEANNKSPLELVRRAISLKIQFKEFGRNEIDEVGDEVFTMDNHHRENFADATKAAAVAVLEALAECELPTEVILAGTTAGFAAAKNTEPHDEMPTEAMFKTICMALIAEAEAKNEAQIANDG